MPDEHLSELIDIHFIPLMQFLKEGQFRYLSVYFYDLIQKKWTHFVSLLKFGQLLGEGANIYSKAKT